MKWKQLILPVGVLGVVVAIWLYLRGGSKPTQISYPDGSGGGMPPYREPAIAYNFGARQPAPAPQLISGALPPLPKAPSYQRMNYTPVNLFNIGYTEAAKAAAEEAEKEAGGCCCDPCDTSGGRYLDGNQKTKLSPNPAGAAVAMRNPAFARAVDRAIQTSALGGNPGDVFTPMAWGGGGGDFYSSMAALGAAQEEGRGWS